MAQPPVRFAAAPHYAKLWCDISQDFNGFRRNKELEGSVDGHSRLFVTPGDAVKFNVLSKRWNKWIDILSTEPLVDLVALAFLATTNQQSIELRLGMAWKGLVAIGAALALQKIDLSGLLGDALRELVSYGVLGGLIIIALWIGFVVVALYMLLDHLWRINASELRACVDLALLTRKIEERSIRS